MFWSDSPPSVGLWQLSFWPVGDGVCTVSRTDAVFLGDPFFRDAFPAPRFWRGSFGPLEAHAFRVWQRWEVGAAGRLLTEPCVGGVYPRLHVCFYTADLVWTLVGH